MATVNCRVRRSTAAGVLFIDPSLPDFSLAYGGNIVGVMLGCTGKVGLDIEVIRARQGGFVPLQQQYLSNTEKVWIARQEDRLEATTQLWAIRQSVLKISGLGNSGLDTLRLQPGAGKLRSSATPQVETLSAIHNDIAWACSRSPSLQRLHYWYMQPNGRLANVDRENARRWSCYQRFYALPAMFRYRRYPTDIPRTGCGQASDLDKKDLLFIWVSMALRTLGEIAAAADSTRSTSHTAQRQKAGLYRLFHRPIRSSAPALTATLADERLPYAINKQGGLMPSLSLLRFIAWISARQPMLSSAQTAAPPPPRRG
ncbi:hypothetical protein O0544_07865 [Edwardsiella anguillarum]|nr:hypothetical protein [Edwardsiella anguillarum]